jgi:hypothetical protein
MAFATPWRMMSAVISTSRGSFLLATGTLH